MAKLDLNLDNFKNLEQPVSEILPVGEYVMQIIKSEVRETKAGTGWYLQLEFDVLSGPCPPKNWRSSPAPDRAVRHARYRQVHVRLTSAEPGVHPD